MKRNAALDAAKGGVIGSVVLGHVLENEVLTSSGSRVVEASYQSIYLFHMPFWFLLSGYLFNSPQRARSYFGKKFRHLMVPYLVWLFVFNLPALAGLTLNTFRNQLAGDKLLFYCDHFASQLYGGLAVHGTQMILWFPTCLFFTQQLANWIIGKYPNVRAQGIWCGFAFVLAYAGQYAFPNFHLPLAVDVVVGALPFFFMGYWLRGHCETGKLKWTGMACFSMAVFALFVWRTPLTYHMRMAEYGVPIVSTLAAIGGFFVVLAVSHWINHFSILAKMFGLVGEASMTIMYVHAVVLVKTRSALDMHSVGLLLACGVLVPTLLHHLLAHLPILSSLFTGSPARVRRCSDQFNA